MKPLSCLMCLTMLACLPAPVDASPPEGDDAKLPPKLEEMLQQVAVRYNAGDPAGVVESLAPLLAIAQDEHWEAIEKILQDQKMPAAGRLLGMGRWAAEGQGLGDRLSRASAREARLASPELRSQLEGLIELVAKSDVFLDPLPMPDTLDEAETLLRQAEVARSRLVTAQSLARFAKEYVSRSSRGKDADQAERMEKLGDDASQLQDDLAQRVVELRAARLSIARGVLENPVLTKDRFLAANLFSQDITAMRWFYQSHERQIVQGVLQRERLCDRALYEQAFEDAQACEKLAGDLPLKARLLAEGLQWWVRGRYGRGTEVWGLAKSLAAIDSPAAQMPLFMPTSTPRPIDPAETTAADMPSPLFDRRHHYWWVWERTKVSGSGFSKSEVQSSASFEGTIYEVTLSQAYCSKMKYQRAVGTQTRTTVHSYYSEQENRMESMEPDRAVCLVGWWEYGHALALLDPLLNMVSPDELRVIEEIVKERDDLAIYVNRSRHLEPNPSPLSEQPAALDDNFERRGLGWVMALARVEMCAIVAGFITHNNPFMSIPPSQYELPQYKELLLDGHRTHYAALSRDNFALAFWRRRQGDGAILHIPSTITECLAYARRTAVAYEFGRAVLEIGEGELTPEQQQELRRRLAELGSLQSAFVNSIDRRMGRFVSSGKRTTTSQVKIDQKDYIRDHTARYLNSLLQRDLTAGRAGERSYRVGP